MKVKCESKVTQSCPTLSDLMDRSLSGSSVHGIFQARVLEWGAIALSEYGLVRLKKKSECIWCNLYTDRYRKRVVKSQSGSCLAVCDSLQSHGL